MYQSTSCDQPLQNKSLNSNLSVADEKSPRVTASAHLAIALRTAFERGGGKSGLRNHRRALFRARDGRPRRRSILGTMPSSANHKRASKSTFFSPKEKRPHVILREMSTTTQLVWACCSGRIECLCAPSERRRRRRTPTRFDLLAGSSPRSLARWRAER